MGSEHVIWIEMSDLSSVLGAERVFQFSCGFLLPSVKGLAE